jgi:hypothetical protein
MFSICLLTYAGQDEVKIFNNYKIIISRTDGMFGDLNILKENNKIFEEKDEYFYFLPIDLI